MAAVTTFGERLQDAMKWSGVTVETLARRRRWTVENVEGWTRLAQATLNGEEAAWLGIELNVSIVWLALGFGSPEPGVSNQRKARLAEKAVMRL